MPVTGLQAQQEISQRDQYSKGGVGRYYWDYRDKVAFSYLKGNTLLDAGCGEGVTLEKIINTTPEMNAIGIDIDPLNIEISQKYGLPVLHASLYELPFQDESFDNCLFMEVIEHLENPRNVLRELVRILKVGGRLIVIFPYDRNMWLARVACLKWREARFDPHHLRQWRMKELISECETLGFRKISASGLPAYFPLPLHGIYVGEKIETI